MKRSMKIAVLSALLVVFTILVLIPSPVQAGYERFPMELPGDIEYDVIHVGRWVCHCPNWINECSCNWLLPIEP